MTNEALRMKALNHKEKYGTPVTWFSRKLGLSKTHMYQFLYYGRDLGQASLMKLEELLE